ncbi:PP2C family protein-serine/threonine phosphatase [Nocardioides mesophilus]|uniref:Serine/threonine-protein phosphatase n=1 Tax=Nocardioides mesophilus TaxID=433659 RepID=A0A7G9R8J7_9ACTN|nr:PP2C family protein-serine/threonine phosphatase [Nocardioides mesophilus]QNN51922.1 serine/threonine-protein phosphatase [Nocardioides mesophilus]
METAARLGDVGPVLDAAEAASPVEAVEAVTRELGRALGALTVSFLVADLSGRALVRLAHVPLLVPGSAVAEGRALQHGERRIAEESATVIPFDGGPMEQTVRTQRVHVLAPGGQDAREPGPEPAWTVLAPVTERGESIGVLELRLPGEPDGDAVAEIAGFAHLLAFVVIANRRHSDLFEWGQRSREFSLSAEIQQKLLPGPRTCEAGAFTLAAWLEPAATIGGDTYDYNLARDVLDVSMTDAMGHGVGAALTASLCVGALRGTRRAGATLLERVTSANGALADHARATGTDDFVTGLVGCLDLHAGLLTLVNAGHVAPYLWRDSAVTMLDLPIDPPLGMFDETAYRTSELVLEPGDRLVLVTDGMLERNADTVDIPAAIGATRSLHPREAVRALADSVLEATGHSLSDDATVLCLDWHGRHDRERSSVSGADQVRASRPFA